MVIDQIIVNESKDVSFILFISMCFIFQFLMFMLVLHLRKLKAEIDSMDAFEGGDE